MAFEYVWWQYFLIPWIAGFVGYITNVLALEMTFRPLEYWGIKLFRLPNEPWGIIGWQGIIPTKAAKMASISFDLMTTRLLNIQEVFNRLDPVKFAEVMDDAVLLLMDKVLNEIAEQYMPETWANMPKEVKDDIIVSADSESNTFMTDFMRDMQTHVEDVVDIKEMCVNACVENKHLIVKIFQECGDKEFVFIRQSGFYFGFLFGLIQMGKFMDVMCGVHVVYCTAILSDLPCTLFSSHLVLLYGSMGFTCGRIFSRLGNKLACFESYIQTYSTRIILWIYNTRNIYETTKGSI
jgi:hypothetical protein